LKTPKENGEYFTFDIKYSPYIIAASFFYNLPETHLYPPSSSILMVFTSAHVRLFFKKKYQCIIRKAKIAPIFLVYKILQTLSILLKIAKNVSEKYQQSIIFYKNRAFIQLCL